jgi:glycosyltransferase involved in cell wall biosynthesis
MKLLCLTAGKNAPSSKFRIVQYERLLRQAGIDPLFRPSNEWPGRIGQAIRRGLVLRSVDAKTTIFLQKPNYLLYPTPAPQVLDKLTNEVILDLDDAVFVDPATGKPQPHTTLTALKYLVARSQVVTVGNAYLADFAAKYNSNVRIIPTAIDTEFYKPYSAATVFRTTVLGWIGSQQHLSELAILKDLWSDLVSRDRCRLLVISNTSPKRFLEITGLVHPNIDYFVWSNDRERELLARIDIGLMPLRPSPYALGKCGFKLIQYMAMGKPAVASPVGVNKEIIRHGRTGMLASEPGDWKTCLEQLLEDPSLRQAMGQAARESIVRRYSVSVVFPRMLEVIRGRQRDGWQ